jgi:peptide chain release factor
MSTRLLVTSGRGPAECRIAVRLVIERLAAEAVDLDCDVATAVEGGDRHGPASAVVVLTGAAAGDLAQRWTGSILWICASPVRPQHKRKNWFVGVVALEASAQAAIRVDAGQVRFEALRAGGPGGQHQNKTESAVRATHLPSGLTVVVRSERSQHRNKALALDRLATIMAAAADTAARAEAERRHAAHDGLQRGNPVRTFRGPQFLPG